MVRQNKVDQQKRNMSYQIGRYQLGPLGITAKVWQQAWGVEANWATWIGEEELVHISSMLKDELSIECRRRWGFAKGAVY